ADGRVQQVGRCSIRLQATRAYLPMAVEEMEVRPAAPGAYKIVVECAAGAGAQNGDHPPGPFFRYLCANFCRDAVNDARDNAFDGLLLEEFPAEVKARRTRSCQP